MIRRRRDSSQGGDFRGDFVERGAEQGAREDIKDAVKAFNNDRDPPSSVTNLGRFRVIQDY